MNDGNLGSVPLAQLFSQLQSESYTGGLRISESNKRYWTLYCQNGRITFATRSQGLQAQMQAQFSRQRVNVNLKAALECHASYAAPEHAILGLFLEHKLINRFQAFEMATVLIKTIFQDLSTLTQAEFFFFPVSNLEPRCVAIQPLVLLQETLDEHRGWEALHPYLVNGLQKLHICSQEGLKHNLPPSVAAALLKNLDGRTSLETVALELQTSTLALARQLHPLVKSGILGVGAMKPSPLSGPLVACIDDSPTFGYTMEKLLARQGLRTLYIEKPLMSMSQLFEERPALIFLDISLPDMDGYQLCKMLRRSPALKEVPVIMLTSKDTLFDRIRANLVGASDYLIKPIQEQKVLASLQSFNLLGFKPKVVTTFSYQG
jgi:twitching motility two-component system response regulator PilG